MEKLRYWLEHTGRSGGSLYVQLLTDIRLVDGPLPFESSDGRYATLCDMRQVATEITGVYRDIIEALDRHEEVELGYDMTAVDLRAERKEGPFAYGYLIMIMYEGRDPNVATSVVEEVLERHFRVVRTNQFGHPVDEMGG